MGDETLFHCRSVGIIISHPGLCLLNFNRFEFNVVKSVMKKKGERMSQGKIQDQLVHVPEDATFLVSPLENFRFVLS